MKSILFIFLAGTVYSTRINTEAQCANHRDDQWKIGFYWTEDNQQVNGKFIPKTPADTPSKIKGKKRIAIVGDSLASDDNQWGWAPHLGYSLAHENLPFEVVNFAWGGAEIAPPALYKGPETNNCFNTPDTKLPLKWAYQQGQAPELPKYENAKASKPDFVILQLGLNDVVPRCFQTACESEQPKPQIPQCFSPDGKEETQFLILQDKLTKLVQEIKGWESKPQVVLLSNMPFLTCCQSKMGVFSQGSIPIIQKYANHKLPELYQLVAQNTGIKFINMHKAVEGKSEQYLCEMQQFVSGPGWCDHSHYGRPEIIEQLKKTLIQPELAIMEKAKVKTANIASQQDLEAQTIQGTFNSTK